MKIQTAIWYLSLFLITAQQFPLNSVQASNLKQRNTQDVEAIKNCPREFTNWDLIESFTTKTYSLSLCQQAKDLYLVGHQKKQHEAFISAKVISQNSDLVIAEDEFGFFFELSNSEFKIFQDNQLIVQENILDPKLTGIVWQLQEILYNNDEFIEVDKPEKYTIEFFPDGQLNIKADCNLALGTYTRKESSISIKIGPTTLANCPPESISEQYLQELQAATIFFFKDGYLYFDLKFDTGTMKFITENN